MQCMQCDSLVASGELQTLQHGFRRLDGHHIEPTLRQRQRQMTNARSDIQHSRANAVGNCDQRVNQSCRVCWTRIVHICQGHDPRAQAQFLPLLDFVDMDGAVLIAKDVASGVHLDKGRAVFPNENGNGVRLL